MKKTLLFAALYSVLGLICPALIHAQDIHVNCATVNPCTLTPAGGIAWSQTNPTWIFAPSNPASSILISVHNNNTTSAHTATIKVFQTSFGRTTAPTLTSNADFWVQDAVTQNTTASASCNSVAINTPGTPGASGVGTCYVVSMYAAQVAIQVTNTSLQAGSPDTYDLSIVQQPGYISGPQPGEDSSSGGGIIFNSLGAFGSGVTTANPRILECSVGGIVSGCSPAFSISVAGSIGRSILNSAQGFNSNGSGSLSVAPTLSDGNTNTSAIAVSQSSTNATSSANATGTTLGGVQVVTSPATWTVPAQATTASNCSASLAATATTRHCAVGVQACIVATAAQTQLFVNLRDGATGAGTVKWNGIVAGTIGTGECVVHEFAGGPICGTINTAMTLELSANTAATNGCALTVRGYDVQ